MITRLAGPTPTYELRPRGIPRGDVRARRDIRCDAIKVASFSSARYVIDFIKQPLTQHWETSFLEVRHVHRSPQRQSMPDRRLSTSDGALCGEQTRLTKETAPLAEGHAGMSLAQRYVSS
jgi:hypothetical protein